MDTSREKLDCDTGHPIKLKIIMDTWLNSKNLENFFFPKIAQKKFLAIFDCQGFLWYYN